MDIGKFKHCMQRWANKRSFEQVKYEFKQDHILICSITPKQHQKLFVLWNKITSYTLCCTKGKQLKY